VKNRIAFTFIAALSLGTWLLAQRPPPGPPEFARPNTNAPASPLTPAPLTTNQVDEMLRALRGAMTNSPAGPTGQTSSVPSTNQLASVPTTAIPTLTAPQAASTAARPATNLPAVFPPLTVNPPAATVQTQPTAPATPPIIGVPAAQTQTQTPAPGTPPAIGEVQPTAPGVPAAPLQADRIIQKGLLQLQGMSLDQFFEIYAMVSGRTVLRPYQLQAKYQQITLKAETDWTRQEAIYAMDTVLALNDIAMIPVGEKFVKAVPFAIAALEGADVGKTNIVEAAEGEQFVTEIIELKTVKPSELSQLLASFTRPNGVIAFDGNNTLVLRDYASNVKRMLEIVKKVDVMRDPDYKLEIIPIKYGKVEDLYNTMSSLISGQAATAVAGATQTQRQGGRLTGGSALSRGGGFGAQSGYGGGYRQSGYGGYGSMQPYGTMQPLAAATTPTTAGGAQTSFQQRLQQIVNRAAGGEAVQLLQDARIVPDLKSNSLLLYANKRDIEMITNIVAKVDVLLAQVLIEAIIMEVSLNDSSNLGVSMLQNPRKVGNDLTGAGGVNNGQPFLNNITNLASGLPSGFSYFGNIRGDLDLAVTAIARQSTINVISRPQLQTSHAIPGEIVVAEAVPYVTGSYDSYYGGFGGGLGSRSIVQTVNIGITLSVTPFITPEGLVVMEIEQHASQRGADVIIDGNPIPVVNERASVSTLTVRDGQSIMMGGFITESRSKGNSGVPVLKDIPGLGALFRSKNKSNNRSELVILMKATVLRTPDIAAEVAETEKSLLPGVQKAEEEFGKDEQKRRQKNRPTRNKPEFSAPNKQALRR
jgi:general secretion pathway protein D